jgi:AraC-like DNA-binding protein
MNNIKLQQSFLQQAIYYEESSQSRHHHFSGQYLNNYFEEENSLKNGLPSVKYISTELKLSQRYLSDMLSSLTGMNTQQYIQNAIIEKAKEKLSTTNLSVSEIAYELGFEHSQSFLKAVSFLG